MDYGTDFLLLPSPDGARDLASDAAGNAALVSGADAVSQDLITRIITPRGSLFYDMPFGTLLHEALHKPLTADLLGWCEEEAEEAVETDPRVAHGSVKASGAAPSPEEGVISVDYQLIGEDTVRNLVIRFGDNQIAVLEDYRP